MSKHTPGPWTCKVSPHDSRVVLIDSKTHGAIGELVYADTRKPADARLIAAAPELLAESAALIEALKGMAIHPSHYAALEAAITKAEAA